ncbi:MAG: hypothetical protein AB7K09_23600, partial [Planctomycetota bacterium]
SWAVVFMSRRMEGREALVKLAASRLSLHSPTHSVLARIEALQPLDSASNPAPEDNRFAQIIDREDRVRKVSTKW